MTTTTAKLVLSKKLFIDKSNVYHKLYFPGNFLEIVRGGGKIIGHSRYNLHVLMAILPGFHKQHSYQYFHI